MGIPPFRPPPCPRMYGPLQEVQDGVPPAEPAAGAGRPQGGAQADGRHELHHELQENHFCFKTKLKSHFFSLCLLRGGSFGGFGRLPGQGSSRPPTTEDRRTITHFQIFDNNVFLGNKLKPFT